MTMHAPRLSIFLGRINVETVCRTFKALFTTLALCTDYTDLRHN